MDEKEVVKLFLSSGFQLSNPALSLATTNPKQIISGLKRLKPRPFIVTEEHIKKVMKKPEEKHRIKILKEFRRIEKPIRIEDYVKHLLSHYEKIRAILSKHTGLEKLISINKISPKTKDFSIIGIVREKGENNLLVEDPTGETNVFFEDDMKQKSNEIILDDVVGLRCKKVGEKCYVDTVIFPDIPLSREISRTERETKIMVISNPSTLDNESYQRLVDFADDTKNLSSIFIFLDKGDVKNLEELSKFNLVNISKNFDPTIFQTNNIKILVLPRYFFDGFGYKANRNTLTSVLRQKHILPTFHPKVHTTEDGFTLENIPDIVISNIDESFYKNYKGTTIISNTDAHKVFLVDLKTREVVEKSL